MISQRSTKVPYLPILLSQVKLTYLEIFTSQLRHFTSLYTTLEYL